MPGRQVLLGLCGVLVGACVGVVGAFLVPLRLADVPVPVAPLLAVVGIGLAGRELGRATGRRLVAAAPGVGWLAVVLPLSGPGPGGDVVLPGRLLMTTVFLLVGAGTAVLVPALVAVGPGGARRRRSRRRRSAGPGREAAG